MAQTASAYFGNTLFYLGDVIGKTLITTKKVNVYKSPEDTAQPMGYVGAGLPVGVVDFYLEPNPNMNRSGVWWSFRQNYALYYVKHDRYAFDVSALKREGVITVDQQVKEAIEKEQELENAGQSIFEKLFGTGSGSLFGTAAKVIVPIGLIVVGLYAYRTFKK